MRRVFVILLITQSSFAIAEQPATIHISTINVDGLKRTQRDIIDREILIKPGKRATLQEIEESIQRLRNLKLFATVHHKLTTVPDPDGRDLYVSRIAVDERWTTIPIMKFNRGGGISHTVIGAYDINLFGRYLEGGAQVERLGSVNSGVAWFRNPRLLGKRIHLGVDVWDVNRVRYLYAERGQSTEIDDGFLHHRRKARTSLGKEWYWWLNTTLVAELHQDEYSRSYVEEEVEGFSSVNPVTLPEQRRAVLSGIDVDIGRLNHDSYRVDGVLWENEVRQCRSLEDGAEQFNRIETKGSMFKTGPLQSTFAQRFNVGVTSAEHEADWFYIGGLDKLRGFLDARFRGQQYWLSNSEVRIPSIRKNWFVMQHTAFFDIAGVSVRQDAPTESVMGKVSGSSVGTGLRLMSPKVYRLTVRLDYARSLQGGGESPLSFGVQQFF